MEVSRGKAFRMENAAWAKGLKLECAQGVHSRWARVGNLFITLYPQEPIFDSAPCKTRTRVGAEGRQVRQMAREALTPLLRSPRVTPASPPPGLGLARALCNKHQEQVSNRKRKGLWLPFPRTPCSEGGGGVRAPSPATLGLRPPRRDYNLPGPVALSGPHSALATTCAT